jgi:hypothetical protein
MIDIFAVAAELADPVKSKEVDLQFVAANLTGIGNERDRLREALANAATKLRELNATDAANAAFTALNAGQ